MHIFSYKLDHDYGLAPNPFWGVMTLAVCRGPIRNNKNLQIGDWVVGTGSAALKRLNQLIFAMRVDEMKTFDEYWNDPTYECKKPVMVGSLAQIYGDNFYHTDKQTHKIIQEFSAHSKEDGSVNPIHLRRDTDGKRVLISHEFFYFGDAAPTIPIQMQGVCCQGRGYRYHDITADLQSQFLAWLFSSYSLGIHGDPISWRSYKRPNLILPNNV